MEKALRMAVAAVCLVGQVSLICNVSRNGDKTTYTVSTPTVDASNWDFSWINGTNFTIADNSGQIPPVLNSSIASLTTSTCLEDIVSTVSKSTGAKDEYRTVCMGNCSSKDFNHGEEGGYSTVWIAAGVTIVVIPVLAGLAFLCYKISRKSNGSQCGGRYLMGKKKPDPTPGV